MLTNKSHVLFATFSLWTAGRRMPTNGNLEPLRDFLTPRVSRLVLIDQPHPGSDWVLPNIEVYRKRRLVATYSASWWVRLLTPLLELTNQNRTQIVFKIRDFLSVMDWAVKDRTHFDYFIGMESVNTVAGVILKRLGRVGKVVYYVLDYSPQRFSGWLNKVYLALDRFCAVHADYVWDVSPAIHPARIAAGLDPRRSAPVIHVPIGVYPHQIRAAPAKDTEPYSLVYLGTLTEEQGPDLAIAALPLVLKDYPQTTLHIVGGGQANLDRLRRLAASLQLGHHVIFHGFVVDSADMATILSRCRVAVAPYRSFPGSIRQYGDSSKLRSYAAAGLPIVTTPVPPLGKQLHRLGGAIVVSDNKQDLARGIVSVFSNSKLHVKMSRRLLNFAKGNTWDTEFENAFIKSR